MPLEAKEIFEAESQSVRKVLTEPGVGFYIPPYQRPYSWARDKVQRLLEDTLDGFRMLIDSQDHFTFLGSIITIHDRDFQTIQPIVRTDVPAKVLNVIDGQQRLTTLLLLCVALHNRIHLMHHRMMKPRKAAPASSSEAVAWLNGQASMTLQALQDAFIQIQTHGTAKKYPRMIRAFDDQWSRNMVNARYEGPIAHLISCYGAKLDGQEPTEYKASVRTSRRIEGEEAVIERFAQVCKAVKAIGSGKIEEAFEEFPTPQVMVNAKHFQRALVNHELPPEVSEALTSNGGSQDFSGLFRLVLFANYVLDRVAVTVVKGRNEDYAFAVFESLNTTGEPLTAFETFRPRVVSAEGLDQYEKSESRRLVDQVVDYLAGFKAGEPLQAATSDLLIAFASAETGFRLPKRLADQRRYLKEEYDRHVDKPLERENFVRHLRDTSIFVQHAWVKNRDPVLPELPISGTTDRVKLCLAFLYEANHTITIGPLVRFFSHALAAAPAEQQQGLDEFEEAVSAITAFAVLWRASRRGTANIDQEFRDLLTGRSAVTHLAPLARKLRRSVSESEQAPEVNAKTLKDELRARLLSPLHGNIKDREDWVKQSAAIPAYTNSLPVARFLLLAAYHDTVQDPHASGLIVPGKAGVAQCLTFSGWRDEVFLSLEHIAPQEGRDGWNAKLFEDKEYVHRLGNLVMVQQRANSSLSNRSWRDKSVLYAALGASSQHDAQKILDAAEAKDIRFAQSTAELVAMSAHMPHLAALGTFGFPNSEDWTMDAVNRRSTRLLELAWDRLWPWLG